MMQVQRFGDLEHWNIISLKILREEHDVCMQISAMDTMNLLCHSSYWSRCWSLYIGVIMLCRHGGNITTSNPDKISKIGPQTWRFGFNDFSCFQAVTSPCFRLGSLQFADIIDTKKGKGYTHLKGHLVEGT